jgi:hypothetical protein
LPGREGPFPVHERQVLAVLDDNLCKHYCILETLDYIERVAPCKGYIAMCCNKET